MSHIALIDEYNRSHENDNAVFVSATETTGISPATLSVRFLIEHQVCPEDDLMRIIHSVFVRSFAEPINSFAATGGEGATSALRRMLAALELPFQLGKKFEWESGVDVTTSEPLDGGLDDVAARLSEIGSAIARRKRREEERPEISVDIVMLTVVPRALFEEAADLFFRNHVDATSSSSEEENDVELETVSYEGAAGVIRCVICMDDVELGSQVANLPCSHTFHGDCLRRWMRRNATCPLCRHQLID